MMTKQQTQRIADKLGLYWTALADIRNGMLAVDRSSGLTTNGAECFRLLGEVCQKLSDAQEALDEEINPSVVDE